MDRRKKYRENNRKKLREKAEAYRADKHRAEIEKWTTVKRCLDGVATEKEYCDLDGNFASYGPEGLKVVGPNMGPITISPSLKARKRFGQMVYPKLN